VLGQGPGRGALLDEDGLAAERALWVSRGMLYAVLFAVAVMAIRLQVYTSWIR
jgi:hypothetical protein